MKRLRRTLSRIADIFRNKTYKTAFRVLFCTDSCSRERSEPLYKYYTAQSPKLPLNKKRVIYMFDGRNNTEIGLSDRLRGCVFAYILVKEMNMAGENIDFSINFTHPFELSEYLSPASECLDWRITPEQISYNDSQAEVIWTLSQTKPGKLGFWRYKRYLKSKIVKSDKSQFHLYSNTADKSGELYSQAFAELFRPSPRIAEELEPHLMKLQKEGGYLSVTLRFQNLLGDFDEGACYGALDTERQRQELMDRCVEQIELLHEGHKGRRILVTSDSRNFLNRVKSLPYTYTVDGELVHMAFTEDSSFDLHKKAFIDYLMIASAEKVYLLRTGEMYRSGFPQTASMIYNRPFERIEF